MPRRRRVREIDLEAKPNGERKAEADQSIRGNLAVAGTGPVSPDTA